MRIFNDLVVGNGTNEGYFAFFSQQSIEIFKKGLCRPLHIMPDSFFAASKPRKRKRSMSAHDGKVGSAGNSTKFARKDGTPGANRNTVRFQKKKEERADEELDSDQTNEEDGGIDDLDLRHGLDSGLEGSGDEDEDETPAAKRLRLAQLYLDSVKDGLGMSPHRQENYKEA